ncbi:amidase domain-containing protein [Glaciihabitans sp. dw_435]|uniref:amidase domain-containing protein n=1 Tax=Glaciihabitans sp. dw_435 TaxID=2720081 RepID=UPI001BD326E8|nr:amidase domain-containing protein [Glaciihabitans sp. dw_435]
MTLRRAVHRPLRLGAIAFAVALAGTVLVPTTAMAAPGTTGASVQASTTAAAVPAPIVKKLSITTGSTAGTRRITLTGTNLGSVRAISFGKVVPTEIRIVNSMTITLLLGPAKFFQPAKVFVSVAQRGVAKPVTTKVAFTYKVLTAVDREMNYAFDNWNAHGTKKYVYISANDCVNFASQVLRARGWTDTANWFNHGGWDVGTAWVSSTALKNFIAARPARATALTDAQRASVKIGDVVQFDWDKSGDRDHTAIISKKTVDADGHVNLYYVAHTDHVQFRSVDWAITTQHPGAKVYYWSVK